MLDLTLVLVKPRCPEAPRFLLSFKVWLIEAFRFDLAPSPEHHLSSLPACQLVQALFSG
jgi:hypothetical protein